VQVVTTCPQCGAQNAIVNQCGCDPNNLPTRPSALVFLMDKHKPGAKTAFTVQGREFELKYLRRGVWHLRDTSIAERSRSGTKQEIRQDVGAVQESGALPGGRGGRW
jgi:hypothetical protein